MHTQCKIEGCTRGITWKDSNVCSVHSRHRTDKICTQDECELGQYANQLCRNHHERSKRAVNYLGTKCKSSICKSNVSTRYDYCYLCRVKISAGKDPDIKYTTPKGSLNWRWNGGVAYYKNHRALRQLRKQRIEDIGGKCEECLAIILPTSGLHVHHIDGDKNNHVYENLKLLCCRCRSIVYGPKKPSKKYGKHTMRELASLTGYSYTAIWRYIKKDIGSKKLAYKIDALIGRGI